MQTFAAGILISSAILGYEVTRFLSHGRVNFIGLIGASFPVGAVLNSLFGLIFNPFVGCSLINCYIQIFLSIFVALLLRFVVNKRKTEIRLPKVVTCLFILAFFGVIYYVCRVTLLQKNEDEWILTGENDLLLEVSMAQSFVRGVNHWSTFFNISNVLVSNNTLKSEYLNAEYTAFLINAGFSQKESMFYVSLLLFMSISVLTFALSYLFFGNELIASISMVLVFLLSGYGIINALDNGSRNNMYTDYVFMTGINKYVSWGHELIHCLITSRTCLFAMSLSTLVYILVFNDCNVFAGCLTFVVVLLRPPSAAVLYVVFLLFKKKGIVVRAIFTAFGFALIHQQKMCVKYGVIFSETSSRIPTLEFIWNVLGIAPIGVMINFLSTKRLAPLVSFAAFCPLMFIALQEDIRFNFFAAITALYPVLTVFSVGGFLSAAVTAKSKSVRGALTMLMTIIVLTMGMSTTGGLINRMYQTFEPFNEDIAGPLGQWIIDNTKITDVFYNSLEKSWPPSLVFAGRNEYVSSLQAMQAVIFNNTDYYDNVRAWTEDEIPQPFDYLVIDEKSSNFGVLNQKAEKSMQLVFKIENTYVYGRKVE